MLADAWTGNSSPQLATARTTRVNNLDFSFMCGTSWTSALTGQRDDGVRIRLGMVDEGCRKLETEKSRRKRSCRGNGDEGRRPQAPGVDQWPTAHCQAGAWCPTNRFGS